MSLEFFECKEIVLVIFGTGLEDDKIACQMNN